jgi:hypothetical protein
MYRQNLISAFLTDTVAAIVRNGEGVTDTLVRAKVPASVLEADRERFVTLVLDEFRTLHAGNVVRFGLRPLEFSNWQQTLRPAERDQ